LFVIFYVDEIGRTGFAALINMMRKYKNIDSVFDWTIGYIGKIPQNESAVLFGMPTGLPNVLSS
jgi:hypothetical protein